MTRLIIILTVILSPMAVPAGNASAANGPVNDTTRPIATKKPVVLTIDGICFTAAISIVLNQTCWTDYLKDAFSSDLADDYHVASSPWTGDPKETPKILSFAEKTIRGYSEVAKRRGQPFQIIAHSWGSVLAYIVLKNNPGIQVETLITLGSPLQSQDKIVVEKYTSRYAGTTILKPGNVRRWVNYWAWNDLISGSIDVADKNSQIDENVVPKTDYDTRLMATKDFHSQYYTAWKSQIIANLVHPGSTTTVSNRPDYSAQECAQPFTVTTSAAASEVDKRNAVSEKIKHNQRCGLVGRILTTNTFSLKGRVTDVPWPPQGTGQFWRFRFRASNGMEYHEFVCSNYDELYFRIGDHDLDLYPEPERLRATGVTLYFPNEYWDYVQRCSRGNGCDGTCPLAIVLSE